MTAANAANKIPNSYFAKLASSLNSSVRVLRSNDVENSVRSARPEVDRATRSRAIGAGSRAPHFETYSVAAWQSLETRGLYSGFTAAVNIV